MEKRRLRSLAFWLTATALPGLNAQETGPSPGLLETLMQARPASFAKVLADRDQLRVQVIYTQIDRNKKGKPVFRDHYFRVDTGQYFYPASTVKLPIAILALQKLNELAIPGLDMNSTMITGSAGGRQTEVWNDPSAPNGKPSIAHYIRKILLVSDNDAFNRLYEFLGQEYINQTLLRMGYAGTQIIHRLDISLSEEENRSTNPVRFYDSTGKLLYDQPAQYSRLDYAERNTRMGKGYYRAGERVMEPFDFSKKNRLPLPSLHWLIRSVMFPESVDRQSRFKLTAADYNFLRRYMSMLPAESVSPRYDPAAAWDTYVKFLYYGAEKGQTDPAIRIFNKPGDAYGFMIDAAYIADFSRGTECIISAVIHCNADGIYNDDLYEYNAVGLPFLRDLGRMIMEYEQTRVRKHKPDLRSFLFRYTD